MGKTRTPPRHVDTGAGGRARRTLAGFALLGAAARLAATTQVRDRQLARDKIYSEPPPE